MIKQKQLRTQGKKKQKKKKRFKRKGARIEINNSKGSNTVLTEIRKGSVYPSSHSSDME